MSSLPERYVLLCHRVARHIDGFIDLYYGPPELKGRVDSEEPLEPKLLRDEAAALLEELPSADLEPDRARWLSGQLTALECVAARLAGEEIAWTDEVERCLGVRPSFIDEGFFREVHSRLDAALPGTGSVRERYIAWDHDNSVPAGRIVKAMERIRPILQEATRRLVDLPSDEEVRYELVSDETWTAYNWYEGGHRSLVQVNVDLPISIGLLIDLAAHEAYPGHHTERTAKEARLWERLQRLETTIAVVAAPEALISEGIAMTALDQALGTDAFEVVREAVRDLDIDFDTDAAAEVYHAELGLYAAAVDAAFMIHEENRPHDEVEEFLREWGLESDERASKTVAFVLDETWRGYLPAYLEGRRLCSAFCERAPGNFTRLLTEQLTTADLLA